MREHTKLILVCGLILLTTVVGVVGFGSGRSEEGHRSSDNLVRKSTQAPRTRKEDVAKRNLTRVASKDSAKRRVLWYDEDPDDDEHPYSPADKKLAKALQAALDDCDDLNGDGLNNATGRQRLLDIAREASLSGNPAVRERAIDALEWLGPDALVELTPMMADSDEDVAEKAIDTVGHVLEDVTDNNLRFETAAAYMNTFSVNENALTMLGGVLVSAALEIIEPGSEKESALQKAYDNRILVVDALAEMIEKSSSVNSSTAAREAYSEITGEEWHGRSEAEKWASDPDNYEAPEDNM